MLDRVKDGCMNNNNVAIMEDVQMILSCFNQHLVQLMSWVMIKPK